MCYQVVLNVLECSTVPIATVYLPRECVMVERTVHLVMMNTTAKTTTVKVFTIIFPSLQKLRAYKFKEAIDCQGLDNSLLFTVKP